MTATTCSPWPHAAQRLRPADANVAADEPSVCMAAVQVFLSIRSIDQLQVLPNAAVIPTFQNSVPALTLTKQQQLKRDKSGIAFERFQRGARGSKPSPTGYFAARFLLGAALGFTSTHPAACFAMPHLRVTLDLAFLSFARDIRRSVLAP